jgi:hypothetical protein
MTLEQYEILAYHFLFLTFFIPSIYDTIKFVPTGKRPISLESKLWQYFEYAGVRIWNSHFGDLFVGIFLAVLWPLFSLGVVIYLSFRIYKLFPKKTKRKVK